MTTSTGVEEILSNYKLAVATIARPELGELLDNAVEANRKRSPS